MNSPRRRDPESLRARLLDAGLDLLLAKGYGASTVEAICSAAGVTKGAFFHHFASKEDLAKGVLERFAEQQRQRFADARGATEDPLERVYRIVDCALSSAQDPDTRGCVVGTMVQEVAENHPQLLGVCAATFGGLLGTLSADLVAAKSLYRPADSFDAAELAAHFLALVQGSFLISKATGDRDVLTANLRHFQAYLRLLFGR